MVTKWGLSEELGPLAYSEEDGEVFLGHSVTRHKTMADDTAKSIDSEVRSIAERNYKMARKILEENIDKVHLMADALMKYETIDKKQIDDIMSGKKPRPPEHWDDEDPDSTSSEESKTKADSKIGGPASSH